MCGIAGCSKELISGDPEFYLARMNEVMKHRGPDDGDFYHDKNMGLCHRRLSIIDVSSAGKQPMVSSDSSLVIVFNGEIYNFTEIRKELEALGHLFRTKTDTEVLLNAYKEFGLEEVLRKIRGMYAFAIWDKEKKDLILVRDRIGKKPLYYFCKGNNIAFASEIKSLLEIPGIDKEIDPTAIMDYLKYLYIPHPKSIFKNIFKLEPGHYLTFSRGRIKVKEYWDVDFSKPLTDGLDYIADQLLELIKESVNARLISDVPLGTFLSGGIDSSAVVALMSEEKGEGIKTCTIGFDDEELNEAPFAKIFAERWKTDHHEYYVRIEENLNKLIKNLIWHFDEPFADPSMVPTYHVCRVARNTVTVALSGDGGDESFGGYEKYSVDFMENRIRKIIPAPLMMLAKTLSGFAKKGVVKQINSLSSSSILSPMEGYYVTNTFLADSFLRNVLSDSFLKEMEGYNPGEHTFRYFQKANGPDHLSRVLYTDLKSFLPGDILVKVDRMSMANSLEVRSPLLDHKVIEYAAKIPSSLKLMNKNKKIVLKRAFHRVLSDELMSRKKRGFDVPLDSWMRRELKQLTYLYLFEKTYMDEYFNGFKLKKVWDMHQNHQANYGLNLWAILVFSVWYDEFAVNQGRG